ncbi:hypothetical protein [Pseudoduganella violacea]|uniref:Uncharacterized protein n=1 Tax=Pseudoduganella violacea TaxID=1715466 RepID=A0A7W5B8R5_9BURK|nr:hypothetical protein [Pseudoduganella violacea]MBB3118637.1 hypothetical protein [Pseudoduganella violacea]
MKARTSASPSQREREDTSASQVIERAIGFMTERDRFYAETYLRIHGFSTETIMRVLFNQRRRRGNRPAEQERQELDEQTAAA